MIIIKTIEACDFTKKNLLMSGLEIEAKVLPTFKGIHEANCLWGGEEEQGGDEEKGTGTLGCLGV